MLRVASERALEPLEVRCEQVEQRRSCEEQASAARLPHQTGSLARWFEFQRVSARCASSDRLSGSLVRVPTSFGEVRLIRQVVWLVGAGANEFRRGSPHQTGSLARWCEYQRVSAVASSDALSGLCACATYQVEWRVALCCGRWACPGPRRPWWARAVWSRAARRRSSRRCCRWSRSARRDGCRWRCGVALPRRLSSRPRRASGALRRCSLTPGVGRCVAPCSVRRPACCRRARGEAGSRVRKAACPGEARRRRSCAVVRAVRVMS